MHRSASSPACVFALLVLAAPATAQRGGLSGRVLDASTGAPVSDAVVAIHGRTVRSNEAGFFSLLGVPADLKAFAAHEIDIRVGGRP